MVARSGASDHCLLRCRDGGSARASEDDAVWSLGQSLHRFPAAAAHGDDDRPAVVEHSTRYATGQNDERDLMNGREIRKLERPQDGQDRDVRDDESDDLQCGLDARAMRGIASESRRDPDAAVPPARHRAGNLQRFDEQPCRQRSPECARRIK